MKSKVKNIKESNPEALYFDKPKNNIPYSIGSLRQSNFDIFSPRGDHAQDAFDQTLGDKLKDFDIDLF